MMFPFEGELLCCSMMKSCLWNPPPHKVHAAIFHSIMLELGICLGLTLLQSGQFTALTILVSFFSWQFLSASLGPMCLPMVLAVSKTGTASSRNQCWDSKLIYTILPEPQRWWSFAIWLIRTIRTGSVHSPPWPLMSGSGPETGVAGNGW